MGGGFGKYGDTRRKAQVLKNGPRIKEAQRIQKDRG
jgi:hypothetical protein